MGVECVELWRREINHVKQVEDVVNKQEEQCIGHIRFRSFNCPWVQNLSNTTAASQMPGTKTPFEVKGIVQACTLALKGSCHSMSVHMLLVDS